MVRGQQIINGYMIEYHPEGCKMTTIIHTDFGPKVVLKMISMAIKNIPVNVYKYLYPFALET